MFVGVIALGFADTCIYFYILDVHSKAPDPDVCRSVSPSR